MTFPADDRPEITFTVANAIGDALDFKEEILLGRFGTGRPARFTISKHQADGTYVALFRGATTPFNPTSYPATITGGTLADYAALFTEVAVGTYTYKFPAGALPATPDPDPAASYKAAMFSSTRTVNGVAYRAGTSFDFSPTGTVTHRDVVTDAACNACHKNLTAHGSRRTVGVCLTCHEPGPVSSTGEPWDFRVMVHKLHAGGYVFNPANDFSHVVFPDMLNGVKNCAMCHAGASQPVVPSIAACGSCHPDLTDPAALTEDHSAMTTCATGGCHTATSVTAPNYVKAHSSLFDPPTNTNLTGRSLDITIDSVDANTTAPTVTFTVKMDGVAETTLTRSDFCMLPAGVTVGATVSCGSFRFSIGGPTSDFGSGLLNSSGTNYGYLQSVSFTGNDTDFALITATATPGQYTAPLVASADLAKFAAAAGASVAVGVEAYVLEAAGTCGTGVLTAAPSASATCAVREWAQSPTAIKFAKVGGGTATARRTITDNAKCNKCHDDLGFHGGEARKTPEYCAFCHHPNNVNDERSTRLEKATDGSVFKSTPNNVSIMNMAHKLHAGSALSNVYVLGADRSLSATAPIADEVEFLGAFPGDLADCQTCHAANTYGLPDAANLGTLEATYECLEYAAGDADNFCNTLSRWPATNVYGTFTVTSQTVVPPQTAACTSCHDSDAAKAHAMLNTTISGIEACAACHGSGRDWDAVWVHVPTP